MKSVSISVSLPSLNLSHSLTDFFQFIIDPQSKIVSDVIDIGKAVSVSGFIAVPLVLFLQHNLLRTIDLKDSVSYSVVLFLWVMSSQIFL